MSPTIVFLVPACLLAISTVACPPERAFSTPRGDDLAKNLGGRPATAIDVATCADDTGSLNMNTWGCAVAGETAGAEADSLRAVWTTPELYEYNWTDQSDGVDALGVAVKLGMNPPSRPFSVGSASAALRSRARSASVEFFVCSISDACI